MCNDNYSYPEFWQTPFADGILPTQIDAFYCFNYVELNHGIPHYEQLVNLFVKYAKVGATLMLGHSLPQIKDLRSISQFLTEYHKEHRLSYATTREFAEVTDDLRINFITKVA